MFGGACGGAFGGAFSPVIKRNVTNGGAFGGALLTKINAVLSIQTCKKQALCTKITCLKGGGNPQNKCFTK